MKKILMVGPVPPPTGGIASVMQDIVDSELASEFQFEVFARSDFPPDLPGTTARNVFRLRRLQKFYARLRSGKYYLVHIHSPDEAFFGSIAFMLLARSTHTRLLLHMHGTDWDEFYTRKSFIRKLYHQIRAISGRSDSGPLFSVGRECETALPDGKSPGFEEPCPPARTA